jgi:perosamine synthetase
VIPIFKPACGDEEIEAVTRVLRSGWWAIGPETEKFEAEFAAYTGCRHAVAVSSATMALELAARAIGLVNGVVVVPALTFVSSAQAMRHCGNQVIFADIDEDTLCMDFGSAAANYKARARPGVSARGMVPVWYGGHVQRVFSSSVPVPNFAVIEDCAHAAGSKGAGELGDAAAWSFHAVKNLATGDGGMVTTDDEDVAAEVRRLRWCGIDKSTWERDKDSRVGYGWDYDIPGDGFKAHMNDIAAALGRVQLRHLDERNSIRRAIAKVYNDGLAGLGWFRTPVVDSASATHMYTGRVPAGRRPAFIRHCIENGVSIGVHYKPLNHYKALFGEQDPGDTPVTERVWQTLVTLPLFPDMTAQEQEQVVKAVRSFRA